MIVWVNGTFGAGKTTTGTLLADSDDRLRLFDPEWVGFLVRHHLADHEFGDFQELAPWRNLTPVVMDELARFTGQHLVAIQSVLVEDYWREIRAGLSSLGHEILHVVLEADPATMRARIEADQVETGALGWRLARLPVYAESRAWMTGCADLVLDTTELTPAQAAARLGEVVDAALRA